MYFHAECHVTDSDALRRISWEVGQSVDSSPEIIHFMFLIPMQVERRHLNFACVARVCIQNRQKTLPICPDPGSPLRLTCKRSPSVSSRHSAPPLALVATPVYRKYTATHAEFKNKTQRRFGCCLKLQRQTTKKKNSSSLSDCRRQDGKQERSGGDTINLLERDECVISAVVRLFPVRTLCTFCTCA